MKASEQFESGDTWTDETARTALPILILLARLGHICTYAELDREVALRSGTKPLGIVVSYGRVLRKIGQLLNMLSTEWREEVPPLTLLVFNRHRDKPGAGRSDGGLAHQRVRKGHVEPHRLHH